MTTKATARKRELDDLAPIRGEVVRDNRGPMRCMTVAEGYVMWRRPGCVPGVMSVREWAKKSGAARRTENSPCDSRERL